MANERFKWEQAIRGSDLPRSTRHVLLTLATYMDPNGMNGYPSQQELGQACGMNPRTVRRHLDAAIKAGWLVKVRQGRHVGRGASYSNVYAPWTPAGGHQDPAATVDNDTAGGHSRPAASSQEGTSVPQEDKSNPAGGHQRPPTMSDHSKKTSGAGPAQSCSTCRGTRFVGADRNPDGSLTPLRACPECATDERRTA